MESGAVLDLFEFGGGGGVSEFCRVINQVTTTTN
jgi:hypothetical protein